MGSKLDRTFKSNLTNSFYYHAARPGALTDFIFPSPLPFLSGGGGVCVCGGGGGGAGDYALICSCFMTISWGGGVFNELLVGVC